MASFWQNWKDPAATRPIFIIVAASGTERCRWMLTRLILFNWTEFRNIFGVDASNSFLGLWCRIQWNVQVFEAQ